jgi:hypothetical protein
MEMSGKFVRLIIVVVLALSVSLFYSTGKNVSANEYDGDHHHKDGSSDGSSDDSSDDKSSDDSSGHSHD